MQPGMQQVYSWQTRCSRRTCTHIRIVLQAGAVGGAGLHHHVMMMAATILDECNTLWGEPSRVVYLLHQQHRCEHVARYQLHNVCNAQS